MNDTLAALRETGALLEGHFLLSSGRHSDRYFQCARLLQYPQKAAAVLSVVVRQLHADGTDLDLDVVVGPALGGIVVAYELGRLLGHPAFFTERDDRGVMTLRRGFEVLPGTRVLLAEDVVTTGKSSGECAAALEERGAVITALACVVDRREEAAPDLPWPVYAAVRLPAASWEAAGCALCRAGTPLVKPGSRKLPEAGRS